MKVNFEGSINKPAHIVYDAIVDRNKMVRYFISSADASLMEGRTVNWEFGDVGAKVSVAVKRMEENKQIVFEWADNGIATQVVISLKKVSENKTGIQITEGDWELNEMNVSKLQQQTTGWTDFFCCLKAYLLFNVNLRTGKEL